MIEVNGKKYQVLEILKKSKFQEQDLYVCVSEYGYKTCFQRFDIHSPEIDRRKEGRTIWTSEEKEYITNQLALGKSVNDICQKFINPNRRQESIANCAYQIASKKRRAK